MKTLYVDKMGQSACVGCFLRDTRLIWAGSEVCAMPADEKIKHVEYEVFEKEHGVFFIFSDQVPPLDFYTVPYLEIFARDAQGGFLGVSDGGDENAQVYYISTEKKCFKMKCPLSEFLKRPKGWKEQLEQDGEMRIFESLEAAQKELEFIKLPETV